MTCANDDHSVKGKVFRGQGTGRLSHRECWDRAAREPRDYMPDNPLKIKLHKRGPQKCSLSFEFLFQEEKHINGSKNHPINAVFTIPLKLLLRNNQTKIVGLCVCCCFAWSLSWSCLEGSFLLVWFFRIMNNSWQQRVSALPWHSSQVLKQSSGAFQNWTLKKVPSSGKSKEKKKKESQLPPRLYIFAKVQHLQETSLHGLHLLIGNLSFRLKTKQKRALLWYHPW